MEENFYIDQTETNNTEENIEENFHIDQIFEELYPAEAALWCKENNAFIEEIEPVESMHRFQIKEIIPHIPTTEEQRAARAKAYQQQVDPITSHIQRLHDEEPTEEILVEINALKQERTAKVSQIKEQFPYPEA